MTGDRKAQVIFGLALIGSLASDVQPTYSLFGRVGAAPLAVAALGGLLILSRREITSLRIARPSLRIPLAIFAAAATASALIVSLTVSEPIRGDDAAVKLAKDIAAVSIWCAFALIGAALYQRRSQKWIRGASLIAYVLAVGLVMLSPPGALLDHVGFFHFSPNIQHRPRGLAIEASFAGSTVAAFALLLLILSRYRGWATSAVVITATIAILETGSRGSLLVWALALVVYVVAEQTMPGGRRLVAVLVAVAAVVTLPLVGIEPVASAYESVRGTTSQSDVSAATRSAYNSAALTAVVDAPVGLGFGTYLSQAGSWLLEGSDAVADDFQGPAMREAYTLARGDSPEIAPKSLLVYLIFVGGIPGLAAFSALILCLLRQPRGPDFPASVGGAIFLATAWATYIGGIYELPAAVLAGCLLARSGHLSSPPTRSRRSSNRRDARPHHAAIALPVPVIAQGWRP